MTSALADLKISARVESKNVSYTRRIAVKAGPRFVEVIVYDYAADLTGTALVRIPATSPSDRPASRVAPARSRRQTR
jgi:hypothetical protein